MPLTLDGTNGVSAVQAGAVESGDQPAGFAPDPDDPGFVEEKEQAVAQKLQAKLDEPVRASVSVL